ncbi:MAG TPA: ABC transporter permease [candidate division Zixibacteria bacterium]|nr:ABC transporter permease [candidate division Zixibacteria bacterium]
MTRAYVAFVARRVRHSLRELLWTHVLTSGTVAMTLFLFGVFMLLQANLQALLRGWSEEIELHAYLADGAGPAELQSVAQRVRAFPEVEQVHSISREQAWKDFQSALGTQSGLLEGLPRDVLPASLRVTLRPRYRDGPAVEEIAERLRREKGIAAVEYPQEWVERLSLVVLGVRWAKWVLGGVLFVAAFFIVGSMTRLAILARRDEVEIMELVGAPREVIQAPFFVEGVIQGAAGSAVAVFFLWLLHRLLSEHLSSVTVLLGAPGRLQFLDGSGVALILTLGCLLGGCGSLFSLRRYLGR